MYPNSRARRFHFRHLRPVCFTASSHIRQLHVLWRPSQPGTCGCLRLPAWCRPWCGRGWRRWSALPLRLAVGLILRWRTGGRGWGGTCRGLVLAPPGIACRAVGGVIKRSYSLPGARWGVRVGLGRGVSCCVGSPGPNVGGSGGKRGIAARLSAESATLVVAESVVSSGLLRRLHLLRRL